MSIPRNFGHLCIGRCDVHTLIGLPLISKRKSSPTIDIVSDIQPQIIHKNISLVLLLSILAMYKPISNINYHVWHEAQGQAVQYSKFYT